MAEKKESKKTKKRKSASGGKKVARPSSKKPRPKKLVEARIPNNPPVSKEENQVEIPKPQEVETSIKSSHTITVELPVTEQQLTHSVGVVNKELAALTKELDEKLEHNQAIKDIKNLWDPFPRIHDRPKEELRTRLKNKSLFEPNRTHIAEEVYDDFNCQYISEAAKKHIPIIPPMQKKKSLFGWFFSLFTRKDK